MQPLRQSQSIFSSETAYYFRKRSRFAGPVVSRTRSAVHVDKKKRERKRGRERGREKERPHPLSFISDLARSRLSDNEKERPFGLHLASLFILECFFRRHGASGCTFLTAFRNARIDRVSIDAVTHWLSLIAQLSHFQRCLRGCKILLLARREV